MTTPTKTLEMEKWVEICKERLSEAESPLPPDDWKRFEEEYLPPRKLKINWWLLSLSAVSVAAAIALVIFLGRSAHQVDSTNDTLASISEKESVVSDNGDQPSVAEVVAPQPNPKHSIVRHPTESTAFDEQCILEDNPQEFPNEMPNNQNKTEDKSEKITNDVFPDSVMDNEKNPSQVRIAFSPYVKGLTGVQKNRRIDVASPGDVFGNADIHHSLPLSFGLDASVFLNTHLSLTTGLEVSAYRSSYALSKETGTIDQKAYYLGIPLRLDYTIYKTGSLSSWIGFGGKADRLIYGRLGTEKKTDPSFHWSISGDVGIQYDLTPGVGLYLQPEISYYFSPSEIILHTSRIDNPLVFSLKSGLRFSF